MIRALCTKMTGSVAIAVAVIAGTGCARTHYVNLAPPPGVTVEDRAVRMSDAYVSMKNGWQHFFIWGLAPSRRVYPVDEMCGSAANVDEVFTQESFVQGLIAQFAGYYVNIYSPYTAEVSCLRAIGTEEQAP